MGGRMTSGFPPTQHIHIVAFVVRKLPPFFNGLITMVTRILKKAEFCLNYVNGLLNKRSDNTKLGLADLVGVNDNEYKLMFENIENNEDSLDQPNKIPKIR